MMKRYKQWIVNISATLFFLIIAFSSVLVIVPSVRSQISEIMGIAVASSVIRWNNVKDAAQGDNLVNGVMAVSPYMYDGANFDMARGDTTSGLWVNVKAILNAPTYTSISTTITTNQVSVDATVGGTLIRAINTSRRSIIVRNQGAVDMYVGPIGITTLTGLLIRSGEFLTLDRGTAAIYGITAAGSTTVGYLEE